MEKKFGQFDWKCWKDEKPKNSTYIYVYLPDESFGNCIDIGTEDDYNWDEDMYWAYVFIPDAPKIEKNKDEMSKTEKDITELKIKFNDLENLVKIIHKNKIVESNNLFDLISNMYKILGVIEQRSRE